MMKTDQEKMQMIVGYFQSKLPYEYQDRFRKWWLDDAGCDLLDFMDGLGTTFEIETYCRLLQTAVEVQQSLKYLERNSRDLEAIHRCFAQIQLPDPNQVNLR